MSYLKAVYFLRPTSENIQHLRRQIANPRFGEYHVYRTLRFTYSLIQMSRKLSSKFRSFMQTLLHLILSILP
ncbi:hypothetical protein K1719_013524 [Acacia pycnantha]|nr:hypothetical protein K1719_013524 [Acacia pycnantha]